MTPTDRQGFRERARLRRMMSEAAALPPGDPVRREIEASITKEGEWAEQEWLETLRFDEEVRLRLQTVEPPPGLERSLLSIATQESGRRRPRSRGWWWGAAAAGVAAVVVAGLFSLLPVPGKNEGTRLRTLALLAMSDHLADRHLTTATSEARVLEQALGGKLPFRVAVPDLGPGIALKGGRRCSLGPHPVLYSLWNRSGKECSLFQFRPDDFGLPDRMEAVVLVPDGGAERESCQVKVWVEEGRGYALVGER